MFPGHEICHPITDMRERKNMRFALFVVLGCLAGCVGSVEDEAVEGEGEDEMGVQRDAIVVSSASYAGSTVTLGAVDNDSMWIVNQSDSVWPESTRLTATVAHGGALNAAGVPGSTTSPSRSVGCPRREGFSTWGGRYRQARSSSAKRCAEGTCRR
jgi:hypothetical protein